MPHRPKIAGQPTRGKTALNRLRQVDVYASIAYADMLRVPEARIADLGYGAYPWTTLEMAERWWSINPTLRFVGVEIDPERVAAAQPYSTPPQVEFKLGGFNLADNVGPATLHCIRAYNVLRQYDEHEVPPALKLMAMALQQDGLLIEGTSTPSGRLVAFDVYQRAADTLRHRALVFGTNFRSDIVLLEFQAILPKRLIHHMLDDRPAHFFSAWQRALTYARSHGERAPRRQWIVAARYLRQQFGYPIDLRPRLLRRGFLTVLTPLALEADIQLTERRSSAL